MQRLTAASTRLVAFVSKVAVPSAVLGTAAAAAAIAAAVAVTAAIPPQRLAMDGVAAGAHHPHAAQARRIRVEVIGKPQTAAADCRWRLRKVRPRERLLQRQQTR